MAQLVTVQAEGLAAFGRELREANAQSGRLLTKHLRAAGSIVVKEAQRRAAWSQRIPSSIKVQAGTSTGGIVVRAGGPSAPQAYTFEAPQGRPVRHPVFPARRNAGGGSNPLPRSKWSWVEQSPRPFLGPAAVAKADEVAVEVARLIDDITSRAGFR